MTALAIRPDEWNFPLLLHVAGAMLLIATLTVSAAVLLAAGRRSDPQETLTLARFGFRSMLYAVIPAYILMRIGAQWVEDKEGLQDSDATWLGIGYITADLGALLLVIGTIVTGLGVRKMSRPQGASKMWKTGTVVSVLLLIAYVIALWAMSGKPE
jgi:hypothetical protein